MTPRGLRIALWASLAVNLLVVGAVVSALAFSPERPKWRDTDAERAPRGVATAGPPELGGYARALSPDARQNLRSRLRADPELREGRQSIRAARTDILAALQADPFDADALRAAFEAQRALQSRLADRGLDGLVDVIADMSAEERAALAETMSQRRRFRPPGRD